MKRLIFVAMLVAGCGGYVDPVEGNWSVRLDSPTLDGAPATDVAPTVDITMNLHVEAGEISGTATMGSETVSVHGQSYVGANGAGCNIVLPFQSVTIGPFCKSVDENELTGIANLFGAHMPTYRFTAHR